jgi:hypothetical protein
MALVFESLSTSSAREGLTRQGRGPNRSVVSPSDTPQRKRPSADAGEEVALVEAVEILRTDVADVASVDVTGWKRSS